MRALSDENVIELWERGAARSPIDRALLLLACALPEAAASALADVSVTERDARILDLRMALFGEQFDGVADCPQCTESLEFHLHGPALRASKRDTNVEFATVGGLRFRLPNSRDLAAAFTDGAGFDEEESIGTRKLLQRCCLNGTAATNWDGALCDEAEVGLDRLTADAGLQLRFRCEACSTEWETPLDICSWLWTELDRRARTLLDEVHRLASEYGWEEQSILAMSPTRRAAYLELCTP
jgi:hypothetical protein